MVMEIDLGPAARAFRDELRQWLEANKPEELIGVDAERAALMGEQPAVRAGSRSSARPGTSACRGPRSTAAAGCRASRSR